MMLNCGNDDGMFIAHKASRRVAQQAFCREPHYCRASTAKAMGKATHGEMLRFTVPTSGRFGSGSTGTEHVLRAGHKLFPVDLRDMSLC